MRIRRTSCERCRYVDTGSMGHCGQNPSVKVAWCEGTSPRLRYRKWWRCDDYLPKYVCDVCDHYHVRKTVRKVVADKKDIKVIYGCDAGCEPPKKECCKWSGLE